jgi:DNA-binding response OmpR family regulator
VAQLRRGWKEHALASILVVDDDSALRRLVTTVLERRKFSVAEAADGSRALEMLGKATFDLVITDIVMPEIEGLELVRHVRARHPSAKVMAVSGGGSHLVSYTELAKELGADEVLAKPFTPAELVAAVERVLSGGAAPRDEGAG